MEKDRLLEILNDCLHNERHDYAHEAADDALIEYINDLDITKAYYKLTKWYS